MFKRAVFGSIFVSIVSICLYLGSFYWIILLTFFFGVSIYEMQKNTIKESKTYHVVINNTLLILWFICSIVAHYHYQGVFSTTTILPLPLGYLAAFLFAIPTMLITIGIALIDGEKANFKQLQQQYFCLSYLGFGYLALAFIRHDLIMVSDMSNSLYFAFASVVGVWVSDTFAYLFGKFIGKHKLNPSISPNKTWEGFIGGIFATIIFQYLFLFIYLEVCTSVEAIIYGMLLSIVATAGDLFQSLWKRTMKIKDSGKIIPGHGGILDRMDAQLLAAPFSLFYWILLHHI